MFDAGAISGGKYRVDGIIARGGMGVVLRATHLHLREQVAIKILRPDTQARPESVARFVREARTTVSYAASTSCASSMSTSSMAGFPTS